jgi:hypothetical protein
MNNEEKVTELQRIISTAQDDLDLLMKPTKKVIDMSALINGIDCEFKDLDADIWVIGKLHDQLEDRDGCFKFWKRQDNSGCWYDKCQPRMNHIHAWQGGDCPLPEGFMVKVYPRIDNNHSSENLVNEAVKYDWGHVGQDGDIIAFKVLGLDDGYVMPWEVSDE